MIQMHPASFPMARCTEVASANDIGLAKVEVKSDHEEPVQMSETTGERRLRPPE
jgi:hypothetical protein